MGLGKVRSCLKKANVLEHRLWLARMDLLLACQAWCEDKLEDCEYSSDDGFTLAYATDGFVCNQILVTDFMLLASRLKRKLRISDFSSLS